MPELDETGKRLTFKLVYYGPAMSGKTTNLMCLHDLLSPEMKGDMMVLETIDDRTLFFALLPVGFRAPSGLLIRCRVFTVPGQVKHDGTRKAVLSRADGVVFVADSQKTQEVNSGESFQNLATNVATVGVDFERLPLVVQFNKRDLANIVSEEDVRGRWGAAPWPLTFASALTGADGAVLWRVLRESAGREPLVVELEPIGYVAAVASAATLKAAAALLRQILAARSRYLLAASIHHEAVDADYEALRASESRYKALSEALEQRVEEQVGQISKRNSATSTPPKGLPRSVSWRPASPMKSTTRSGSSAAICVPSSPIWSVSPSSRPIFPVPTKSGAVSNSISSLPTAATS